MRGPPGNRTSANATGPALDAHACVAGSAGCSHTTHSTRVRGCTGWRGALFGGTLGAHTTSTQTIQQGHTSLNRRASLHVLQSRGGGPLERRSNKASKASDSTHTQTDILFGTGPAPPTTLSRVASPPYAHTRGYALVGSPVGWAVLTVSARPRRRTRWRARGSSC